MLVGRFTRTLLRGTLLLLGHAAPALAQTAPSGGSPAAPQSQPRPAGNTPSGASSPQTPAGDVTPKVPPGTPPAQQPAAGAPTTQAPGGAAPAAPPGGPPGKPAPGQPADEVDELVEELLAGGGAADDLAWLYSDAEESAEPTGLVGEPVPVPALPGPGEGTPRKWDPRWHRFAIGHYVLTGTALAAGAAASFIPASPGRFDGRNDVDEWGRTNLGYSGYDEGRWARDLSDVTLSVAVTYPLLIDSLVIMYWYRKSHDVAGQMALISAEAMSVATAIQNPIAAYTSRERPYGRDCGTTIDGQRNDCTSGRRYRSFFSGHTALSFAGASVSCSHHVMHSVFGDPVADGLSCGAGFAVAATTGMMRIVGSQHYITDVGLGALVGTLSGFGLPWLLHYGPLARVEPDGDSAVQNLRLAAVPNGIGIQGDFR